MYDGNYKKLISMNTGKIKNLILTFIVLPSCLFAQQENENHLNFIGKIKPRHAHEIQSSKISIGAEMMDRDYTIYANWQDFLGPLGVKKARIQSGWAKCEKENGVYDWAWLDEIISDMVNQGIEPWIDLCYGNPVYPGGGGTTLQQKALPHSKEALNGWERYVSAIVQRYKHHVNEWEIWNEPNYEIDPNQFGQFVVRTAKAIKAVQVIPVILRHGKVRQDVLQSSVSHLL
jgi:beta-glucosidase/6-phospho-beta-glucosidase/beta-galactosidase